MKCPVCGVESLVIAQYWKPDVTQKLTLQPKNLLLTVCSECDKPEVILNDNHAKKAVTKKLRDYVKLQVIE